MQQDQPFGLAVFGYIADVVPMQRVGDRGDAHGFALHPDVATKLRRQAQNGLGKFAASGPDQSVKPQNLARSHRKADVLVTKARGVVVQFQIGRRRRSGACCALGDTFGPANHHVYHVAAV